MAKETYYFRHDYNARNDNKTSALISDHGPAGYGIYWCIIEMLHEEEHHRLEQKELTFRALAKHMSTSVEQIKSVVDGCLNVYELLTLKDGFIYSERVLRNIEIRQNISENRSKAGKASAEKRSKTAIGSTGVEQVLTGVEQNPTKKRKEKERKEKKSKEDNNVSLSDLNDEHLKTWTTFNKWFSEQEFKNLTQIKEQLTPKQLIKLLYDNDYSSDDIKDSLLSMENYNKVKNYSSVYLTLLKWLKRATA